jgi:hypothetical protein
VADRRLGRESLLGAAAHRPRPDRGSAVARDARRERLPRVVVVGLRPDRDCRRRAERGVAAVGRPSASGSICCAGSRVVGFAGLVLLGFGVLVASLAVRQMGASWRVGIDRQAPGALVASGLYARVRHPI